MRKLLAQPPEVKFINLEYIFAHLLDPLKSISRFIVNIFKWLLGQTLLSIILSFVFGGLLVFVIIQILRLERKRYRHLSNFVIYEDQPKERGNKWKGIEDKMKSENPSDWKAAIIEADELIDIIIQRLGYKEGESMTERLRSIEPGDLDSLGDIYEAHKKKVKMVQEGGNFSLTQEEAKEILEKYKKALKELKYI